jgi:predicted ATP-grasp superfamily ATP-dependent carboligase
MNAAAVELQPKSPASISPAPSRKRRSVGAVVMDADYRGLAVVRSLGRRGIPVWVVQHGDQLVAALSRYNRRTLRWPSHDEEDMTDFLVSLAGREGIRDWLLFPTGDEAAALVARYHSTLAQHFQLTTPPWEVLRWSYDKRLAYKLADSVGVNHPWTLCPGNRDQVAASNCQFPVILKPAYNSGFNRFTASKAWRVDSRDQLLLGYDEARALVGTDNLMIQELIPGGGESQFSYTTLCKDGRPLASLSARRIRQFPMDFGRASTFVETIDDPSISAAAEPLIAAIRYTGLVEIEFKRDHRDGKLKLLDINPRVWGWHSLCGFAGVDYPYLLWLLTTGEPVPQTKALIGARWVRMSTDAPTAFREIIHGRLSLREYLRSIRPPLAPAIFASDDPLPGVLELPLIAYLAGKRILRGNGVV